MSLYQHILLAIDLSEHSKEVALKAQQLAVAYQAQLSIIHVVDNLPLIDMSYDSVLPFNTELAEILLNNGRNNLDGFVRQQQLNPQQQWLEIGRPTDEIIRIAQENNVDLIVIGSHGRHGLSLLLGSTANSILHHASCDVLAVRLQEE